MSLISKLLIVTVCLAGPLQSFARVCSAGTLGDEKYVKLTFNEASTEFKLHESSFEVDESEAQIDDYGKYIIIPNKTVKANLEDSEESVNVFSIILFTPGKAILYLSINGTVLQKNTTLNCD